MAIALTNENKPSTIALSMEDKQSGATILDEALYIYDQATGTYDLPSLVVIEEDKPTVTALTLETKP